MVRKKDDGIDRNRDNKDEKKDSAKKQCIKEEGTTNKQF